MSENVINDINKKAELKQTVNKEFNLKEVINKMYADSTEYYLNDSLIFLSKVISQTKIKNKELVKENFSKFVECREVLEDIYNDMKDKGFNTEQGVDVKDDIKTIITKFKNATKGVLNDSENEYNRERKNYIQKKYFILFNIKKLLESSKNNLEKFSKIYKQGEKQYTELKGSEYVRQIWESIKDIRIWFLEKVYAEILCKENSFNEILYYFDLYFRVSEKKTDRKIMNTLLVNFKEKAIDTPYAEKGLYLKELNYMYLKLLSHIDLDLQKEATKYLFEKFKTISLRSPLSFVKIWVKKYKELLINRKFEVEFSSVFKSCLLSFKKSLVDRIITSDIELSVLYSKYSIVEDIFDDDEVYILKNKLFSVIEEKNKDIHFRDIQDVENYVEELGKFDSIFKESKDLYQEFTEHKKKILMNELRKEIDRVSNKIKDLHDNSHILSIILKIKIKLPFHYRIIVKGLLPNFENNNPVKYYLHKIAEIKKPKLSNNDIFEVDTLKKQYGFLLNL